MQISKANRWLSSKEVKETLKISDCHVSVTTTTPCGVVVVTLTVYRYFLCK